MIPYLSTTLMLHHYCNVVKFFGSRNPKKRAREGGASVFTVLFSSFCISVPPLSEKITGFFQQAGKKEGGLGKGIFARLLSAPKARQCVAKHFCRLDIKTSKQNNFQFFLIKIWRAGVKKLEENCFALLAEVRRAETRSGAIQAFSVQKRFELRSVIATKCNFYQFWGKMIARSPRLQLVSLRKFQHIFGLNQMDGQNQKLVFCPAGDGSELRSNSQMKFVSNFFLSALGGIRSQFLIPHFICSPLADGQRRLTIKL